jgi:hypothetical protein
MVSQELRAIVEKARICALYSFKLIGKLVI